jgi:hypothetical protein
MNQRSQEEPGVRTSQGVPCSSQGLLGRSGSPWGSQGAPGVATYVSILAGGVLMQVKPNEKLGATWG